MLYTGNGSTQSITGVGFQPDFTWIKRRDDVDNHVLFDAVRTATKYMSSNLTAAETTDTDSLTSFDSDGFSLGSFGEGNDSSETYVAWNWLGGGGAVTNTDGTNIDSQVNANPTAGFSICTYEGTGTAGDSFGHGLASKPDLVILKRRGYAGNWVVGSDELTSWDYYMPMNEVSAQSDYDFFNDTPPTASVVILSGDGAVNYDNAISGNGTYVAYCFHSVEGYSKMGSYIGNGNVDGTFIYTGFRPAYYMIRKVNAAPPTGWMIEDRKREEPFNDYARDLIANDDYQEQPDTRTSMYSNGFKIIATSNNFNTSGGTYLYIAFAEYPFKYAPAR